jgi:hypothetical protein
VVQVVEYLPSNHDAQVLQEGKKKEKRNIHVTRSRILVHSVSVFPICQQRVPMGEQPSVPGKPEPLAPSEN